MYRVKKALLFGSGIAMLLTTLFVLLPIVVLVVLGIVGVVDRTVEGVTLFIIVVLALSVYFGHREYKNKP